MKSQDVVVLLKLVSLHHQLRKEGDANRLAGEFSVRGLETSLGISKSEVSASLRRSYQVGLALRERNTGYPKVNIKSLVEFIIYGLKYVFPSELGAMVRGVPTAAAAPVLQGVLLSASEYLSVWPDAMGDEMGQGVKPLYKSVPYAAKRDSELYASLALIDALRLGNPREEKLAQQLLKKGLNA